jgi:hypothetical protein
MERYAHSPLRYPRGASAYRESSDLEQALGQSPDKMDAWFKNIKLWVLWGLEAAAALQLTYWAGGTAEFSGNRCAGCATGAGIEGNIAGG